MPFLGRIVTTSNLVTTDTLIIQDAWQHLHIRGFIAGCSGAGVARILVGSASVDVAGNYASSIFETATNNATSVSAAGWPVAVGTTTGARFFIADIYNAAATVKRMIGASNSVSVAAVTAPIQARMVGIWVDTTNQIKMINLANFDGLTGTTKSANTLTSGTQFYVWGHNDDGG